jgi:DDE superfamily endonuclease
VTPRFLDIAIEYPGSTSDCLAFDGMTLSKQLEDGLLAEGLCLFGDNAYLNTPFMATPYPNTLTPTKDAYNFYHSQLQIRIECAFGMLTHRWEILQSAIPMKVTMKKTTALVLALAKLHNFCINACESRAMMNTTTDGWRLELNGAVTLDCEGADIIPRQMLGGGEHFKDVDRRNMRRQWEYSAANQGNPLPRD